MKLLPFVVVFVVLTGCNISSESQIGDATHNDGFILFDSNLQEMTGGTTPSDARLHGEMRIAMTHTGLATPHLLKKAGINQSPEAEYLLIKFYIKNEGTKQIRVNYNNVSLINSNSIKYYPSSELSVHFALTTGGGLDSTVIPPGISREFQVGFEIPREMLKGTFMLLSNHIPRVTIFKMMGLGWVQIESSQELKRNMTEDFIRKQANIKDPKIIFL